MDEFRLTQRIKEFVAAVGIPAYAGVIERLIRKADANQMEVAHYPGSDTSKARAEPHGGYIMFIRDKTSSGNRKELIYDIMHEMGHCFDPLKLAKADENNKPLVMGREERAWEFADKEFALHSELEGDMLDYRAYQEHCLFIYRAWAATEIES